MKLRLDIPDSSCALNVVVLFANDRGTETFSSSSFSPVDGLVLRRDNSCDGSIEEVLPNSGIE